MCDFARHTNDARIPFTPPAAVSCQQTEVLEKCINDDFMKLLLTENASFFCIKILFANQLKKILQHLQLHEIFIYLSVLFTDEFPLEKSE